MASAPHVTLHVVAPEQLTSQPPEGQVTSHELLPWHVTLPPSPTEMVHWLVPPHVTLPFVPVESVHVLPPVHVEVQPAPHVPPHCDFPAQLVVHPVPQLTTQSFFDSQLKVTLLGGGIAPPSPEPIEHEPPELHEHVCPLQEHDPLQSSELDDAPPQAEKVGNSSANGASHTRRFIMVKIAATRVLDGKSASADRDLHLGSMPLPRRLVA